ncbi:hypothetical protein [Persicitalea jodogahamensis]|uniref:Uncharacterized protein n=1 Tax=Persicitalea jodogahamensis TaxID=402147 RepID=A0A8J3GCC6_9BACT|nr:hypothetical protein [Persicitalea jodogahamensis]GHB87393.1 hypothetical protein GCM10007390_49070 [Persicitalea jodogahamensis]
MKKLSILMIAALLAILTPATAQFVVSDPMHTGVTTLIKMITDPSFKTMVKNIEKLKRVASAVQQFHRGTQVVQTITQASQKMAQLSAAVSRDGHIYPAEYALMVKDVNNLAKIGTEILKDMRSATTQSGGVLEMTDAQRVEFIDKAFDKVTKYDNLIDAYFNKVKAMSIQRSGNSADLASTTRLYEVAYRLPQSGGGGAITAQSEGMGYDMGYENDTTSILDKAYDSPQAKAFRKKQQECMDNQANYYDELLLAEVKSEGEAFKALMMSGYSFEFKPSRITSDLKSVWNWIDSGGQTTEGKSSGGGGADVSSQIEEGIKNFIGPDGKVISNEEMMVLIRIKARELLKPARDELRKKWKLDECMTMGY